MLSSFWIRRLPLVSLAVFLITVAALLVAALHPAVQTRLAERLLAPYFGDRVSWERLRILPGRIEITGFQATKGANALRFSRVYARFSPLSLLFDDVLSVADGEVSGLVIDLSRTGFTDGDGALPDFPVDAPIDAFPSSPDIAAEAPFQGVLPYLNQMYKGKATLSSAECTPSTRRRFCRHPAQSHRGVFQPAKTSAWTPPYAKATRLPPSLTHSLQRFSCMKAQGNQLLRQLSNI